MDFWQLFAAVCVLLIGVGITAWIDFRLKFAPSRDAAAKDLKRIAYVVMLVLTLTVTGYALRQEVSSSAPLTRTAVLRMGLLLAALMLVIAVPLLSAVLRGMLQMIDEQARLTGENLKLTISAQDHMERHMDVTEKLAETMMLRKQTKPPDSA